MKKNILRGGAMLPGALALLSSLLILNGCRKFIDHHALKDYDQVNLVANNDEYHAAHIDPVLLNAWGLAFSPTGIAWISSMAGHVSTVYDKEGATLRPPVNIPSPGGATGGYPTGTVFNGSTSFVLSNGQPARFLFVGVDGVLSGWNGPAGNNALLIKNNSASASYTGLAIAMHGGANMLYAANFRTGKIDVWDGSFHSVAMAFMDPGLPSGFAPFNIQSVGNWLFVMYAKVGPTGRSQAGAGLGYVSIFTTDGIFVKRFASKGALNAPWGVAAAPASFFVGSEMEEEGMDNKLGKIGKLNEQMILVGNFGDGRIDVYSESGRFVGQLKSEGHAIAIDGLWALSFPPATATTIDPNRLYFTAGPDDEKDGLFGYLIKR